MAPPTINKQPLPTRGDGVRRLRGLMCAGLLITACGSTSPPTSASTSASSTPPTLSQPEVPATTSSSGTPRQLLLPMPWVHMPLPWDLDPRATEAQVRQIGLQLAAIQPEMGSIKVSRIESWSDSTCGDIWAADPTIDLVERTKSRFAGGDRPPLSDAQAQQVVAAITETYCHA